VIKSKKAAPEWLQWYIHTPHFSDYSKIHEEHCRDRVHADFGVGFYQCSRKGTVNVEGYLFCWQHARKAEANRPKKK
jgi:hypothetical protein